MNDHFFDDDNQGNSPENQTQRNPAPYAYSGPNPMQPPQKPRGMKWLYVVAAISIAVISFLGGYLASLMALDPELRTLMSVKQNIQSNYYEDISDKDFYDAIFGAINDDLLDDYSAYMTPEEYAAAIQDLQGNREGIGLSFNGAGEKPLKIIRVSGNSPAEAAGVKAGEEVVGCGVAEDTISSCATFDEFAALIDAIPSGREFYLNIRSSTGDRLVTVSKQAYVENYVYYRTKTASYAFTGDEASDLTEKGTPMAYLAEDTAYIQLVQFTGNAAAEFDGAMKKFKEEGKKNLVLDLRGNGGGLLDVMESISGYFCKTATEKKPVVAIADYGERKTKYKAYGNYYQEYFQEDSHICVLADNGSASASECLLGCMLDYGAISYGDICLSEREGVAKTFGKGIMQETRLVNILKQDALKLTTAKILWPKGNCIHGRGILPDDGVLTVAENADAELETQEAIEKLFH